MKIRYSDKVTKIWKKFNLPLRFDVKYVYQAILKKVEDFFEILLLSYNKWTSIYNFWFSNFQILIFSDKIWSGCVIVSLITIIPPIRWKKCRTNSKPCKKNSTAGNLTNFLIIFLSDFATFNYLFLVLINFLLVFLRTTEVISIFGNFFGNSDPHSHETLFSGLHPSISKFSTFHYSVLLKV